MTVSTTDVAGVLARAIDYAAAFSLEAPVPGGVIAVVGLDGEIASAPWGMADLAAGVAMSVEHRFEIGSISKVVTAALVHQLVDEGLIDLDRPVVDMLPWLSFGTPEAPITPRHLLSHTAGLVLGADSIPDELAQVWSMRDLTRSGEPGERFHYSNLGYMTLGVLAVAVTGESLASLVSSRVLGPVGAGSALGAVTHADRASMAVGHWPLHDDRPWVPGDPVTAATWFEVASADGNVAASAAELGCFASWLLGDGSPVLTSASFDALVTPWAPGGEDVHTWGATPSAESSRYGLGVNVESISGHHCVTHGGGMVGYATFLLADRDAGLGVVVLTNGSGEHPAAHVIARVVHRMLLDPSWEPPSASGVVRGVELGRSLLGRFADASPDVPVLTVALDDDGAVAVSSGDATGRLLRTWGSRYVTDHPDLRTFPLTPASHTWRWGPRVLRAVPTTPRAVDPRLEAYVGHYRSWSPWFTNLRIVARDGGLALIAPVGVEAPGDDQDLVEVADGVFRIGLDPWLPERLVVGPVVDGVCISLVRDGCPYSRTPTP